MFLSTQPEHVQKNYLVLARRMRPQSFAELVGQEVVANSMTSMLENRKIPHAFLFTGTRGTGKTSSARILAKSLCCEKGPTPFPCQTCVHCKQITASAHDDVLEIDGASNTGVDNVRELNEAARFYPHSAKYKIFIIDEVHMLSTGAFNALLKTLEEPPNQVVFILATTELHKVPITVRSRCLIFSFKKIETSVIGNHIKEILKKEQITFDEDAVQIIAREAKGSLRDSLSLLEQAIAICGGRHLNTQETKKGLCVQGEELAEKLFLSICTKNTELALTSLQEANQASLDMATLIENTAGYFRSAVLVKTLKNKERTLRIAQLLAQEYDFLQQTSQNLSETALSEVFKTLSQSVREISRSTAPLPWSEMVVIDCILRADWLSASELISLLNSQGNGSIQRTGGEPQPTSAESEKKKLASPIHLNSPPIEKKSEIHSSSATLMTQQPDADSSVLPIDLELFKKFVAHTKTKSEILATKLKFVKIKIFNASKIEFADTAQNATYLALSEQDNINFWESIEAMGLDKAQMEGKYLPPKLKRKEEGREKIKTHQEEPQKIAYEVHDHKETTKTMIQHFQKFTKTQQKNQPQANTISLNDVYHAEKVKAHTDKTNEILARESIQELSKLATEIQILEL